MDKHEDMKCDQCGAIFQSSSEVQSPIKHCPICVVKNRETMLRIMFGEEALIIEDDEGNMSYSTVCEPSFVFGLYALLDTVLNKVVGVIRESPEVGFYRRNGSWMDLSDEDDQFDFDGVMVIDVDSTFLAIYDEAESSGNAIGMDRVKEYMAKNN